MAKRGTMIADEDHPNQDEERDSTLPDLSAPVTITLPSGHAAKVVLYAIVREAHRMASRASRSTRDRPELDQRQIELIAECSEIVGDAIDAPPARRFRLGR